MAAVVIIKGQAPTAGLTLTGESRAQHVTVADSSWCSDPGRSPWLQVEGLGGGAGTCIGRCDVRPADGWVV